MTADRNQPAHELGSRSDAASSPSPVGARFARHDTEMLDVDAIPYTTRETRTVGEMLVDVDQQARALLFDVDGEHASGLIRTWPHLVEAAGQLWAALPRVKTSADDDRPMERLVAHAASISSSLDAGWPGHGAPNAQVARMTETLQEAGRLVSRFGSQVPTHNAQARHDLRAAQARTMHALHTVAHACTVALQAHGRDRYWEARVAGERISLSSWRSPYLVAPTATWSDRFAAAEATTQRYLSGTYAADVCGTARQPTVDDHRISRAIAGWDIQAHRVLGRASSAADHVAVCRTHAFIADASAYLAAAAALRHAVPDSPSLPGDRLPSALHQLRTAWTNAATRWGDLTLPADKPDPRLSRAADELSAALRELTHDATTPRPPVQIARHPALELALDSVIAFCGTSSELAHVLVEKASQRGLVGPARALSRRAHNDIEAGHVTPSPPGDVVWISPADIQAKRLVPLPAPVAESLTRVNRDCLAAATRAFSVAATNPAPSAEIQEERVRAPSATATLPRPCHSRHPALPAR